MVEAISGSPYGKSHRPQGERHAISMFEVRRGVGGGQGFDPPHFHFSLYVPWGLWDGSGAMSEETSKALATIASASICGFVAYLTHGDTGCGFFLLSLLIIW